jgi:hypothetical protein
MQKPRKSEEHHNFFLTFANAGTGTTPPAASNKNPLPVIKEERRKTTRATKEVNYIEKVFSI